ncbi:Isocitrate lyase [Gossypium arboreum]|uniref:Isocitrate lyase n=1 Tax=Gossypium arboreum TaxID=29729 RepID=A0A0B0MLI9_GOSAR|nr:Isocitrate lyase [Gossypium arboreum]
MQNRFCYYGSAPSSLTTKPDADMKFYSLKSATKDSTLLVRALIENLGYNRKMWLLSSSP